MGQTETEVVFLTGRPVFPVQDIEPDGPVFGGPGKFMGLDKCLNYRRILLG